VTVAFRPLGPGESLFRPTPGGVGSVPVLDGTARTDRRRRPTPRIAAGVALIIVAAWILSTFWVSVQIRSPRRPLAAPTASQVWVGSPEQGARAFFRLRLPVPSQLPQTMTLWVEGSQLVTPYVDGVQVAPILSAPNKLIDTQPDYPLRVETIDIRPYVTTGLNIVGLEVVSLNNHTPAFRARVEVTFGSTVQTYGTSPSNWTSTTNAALTGQELPLSGAFARARVNDGAWRTAVRAPSRPGVSTVSVPPDAYTRAASAPALVGQYGARSLVASTVVDFPQGCSEGWLRVAATGGYTVSLDGRDIADSPASNSTITLPLGVYDLCQVATPGRHVLTVATSSSNQAVVYLDGMVRSGSHTVSFATGPGWHQGSQGDSGAPAGILNAPEQQLGVVFSRVPSVTTVPSGPLLADHTLLALELLAAALVAIVLACIGGVALAWAVSAVLCGVLPAVGLVILLGEMRHIVNIQAPFPSTPLMLAVVLGLAVVGVAAAVVWAVVRHGRAPLRLDRPALAAAAPAEGRHWWTSGRWYRPAVVVFAVVWCLLQSYDIMFNPLWQDELSSLAAAQGMRAHILPEWPSGFLYWKSELYSALIAVVGGVAHDNPSVLRELTVLWFGATIVLFGFLLIPLVLPGRRLLQLVTTVVFATAPFELGHAQDIRMYQMVQFMVVLVAVLLLRAIRQPTTRRVAWLMVALVAMYLTHEESFGVLLVVPLALVAADGLGWVRNWRWWVFGGAALGVIAVQLALVQFTHPPIFGVDPSGGPVVQWSPQPFYYLANYFFSNPIAGASITVVSTLAVIGIAVGVHRRDAMRLYLAAFWIVPTAVVSLLLLTKDTRYVFLTVPFVFALAACGALDIVEALRRVATRSVPAGDQRLHRGLVGVFGVLVVLSIMLSLIGGLNDYGTWTGKVFNANIARRWLDYPTAVAYVKAHMEPGDAVIVDGSPNLVGYSLGRAPDYWIPPHRTETLLYVFEKHGQAVDTQYGAPTILNAEDLDAALNSHRRVWLVGQDTVIRSLIPSMRSIVETRFTLQEDGQFVSVYLATQ
jgi:hypothetical protein